MNIEPLACNDLLFWLRELQFLFVLFGVGVAI